MLIPLNLIWQQAQTGDRLGARKELARCLQEQPNNVQAWLLMAELLDEPAQQAECCRKVLRLDPQNRYAAPMLQRIISQENAPEASLPSHPSVQIPELFDYTTGGGVDEERLADLIREDLEKYVARELGSGVDRNALIRHVCETGEMSWPEAEAFVARVALEHEHEIAKRQSPFMLALSVGTLVGGVILILAGGYVILTLFSGELLVRLDVTLYAIGIGFGMVAGGLIGLVRTLKSLREAGD